MVENFKFSKIGKKKRIERVGNAKIYIFDSVQKKARKFWAEVYWSVLRLLETFEDFDEMK